jgi:hypothetical protein
MVSASGKELDLVASSEGSDRHIVKISSSQFKIFSDL